MTIHELCAALAGRPVIAAVRDESALEAAVDSQCVAVFFLGGSILSLPGWVEKAKRAGKAAFAHVDLLQGVKADAAALEWCKQAMPLDGVISTRAPLLKAARGVGLMTIQRLFLVDSSSLATGIRLMRATPPDMVEVLPGLVSKAIRTLKLELGRPVIAGGMITEAEEAGRALQAGAIAVSTSQRSLWK
ncbi:MAG TPA: glycerol-3-phosphate responsive antiterminator [Candidatus Alectryocaccomicrobium excrementavium]|uniref:Glycerol-3-phosphate responsive antiterminator n=1 Tax=Candidatus Alectryocaccomicrobium excrementavium TaxID=2840668 RepID=A0A9D1FYY6_9FIRM|nr:glycerol-3-phosphate responsive antiterminator [Candidatus Alectryocaccomicrobium excrementavium]